MKKIFVIIVMLSLCFCVPVKAQNVKIWPIVFCNTDDENIGASCDNDKERFVKELGIIETALGKGCEVDWMNIYTGGECSKPNLESAISGLRCSTNDVVVMAFTLKQMMLVDGFLKCALNTSHMTKTSMFL